MGATNAKPDLPASTLYRHILDPPKVYSFAVVAAQQTLENVYPVMLRFSASGSVIRMKCGMGPPPGCSATCNPTGEFPIKCSHKFNTHDHFDYEMIPTFFTVIPPHMSVDCGPHANGGVQVPFAISICTKVRSR